jgi:catechol 2,3-dioxygenase-like lactoylglutathione lyase family enzyme
MSPLNANEPIFDLAQLAHVELLTHDLEGTLRFFKDLLGMPETEWQGRSGLPSRLCMSLGVPGGQCSSTWRSRGQSHRAYGRPRLHDFRSLLEDRGLEGIGGFHYWRCLDRLADAGTLLELRDAAGGGAGYPRNGQCLIEGILTVRCRWEFNEQRGQSACN